MNLSGVCKITNNHISRENLLGLGLGLGIEL